MESCLIPYTAGSRSKKGGDEMEAWDRVLSRRSRYFTPINWEKKDDNLMFYSAAVTIPGLHTQSGFKYKTSTLGVTLSQISTLETPH